MPRTMKKPAPPQQPAANGPLSGEVLTLAEAAAYLRLPEDAVQAAVRDQGLPGREVNGEWRFLKTGIQDWLLNGPQPKSNKEAWMALAGVWKDDPTVDALLDEIHKYRKYIDAEVNR